MFTPELRRRDDIAGYAASDGPKAAAFHPWGRRLFVVRGAASQRAAEQEALAACNADPTRKGENGPCFLYAAGEQVVLPRRSVEPLTPGRRHAGGRLRTRSRVASARHWRCSAARTMSPGPMRAPPPTRPLRFRPRPAGPTVGAACPAGSSLRTARLSCASSALERRVCCSPPTAICWRPTRPARHDGTCRGCIMTEPTCRIRCRFTLNQRPNWRRTPQWRSRRRWRSIPRRGCGSPVARAWPRRRPRHWRPATMPIPPTRASSMPATGRWSCRSAVPSADR